MKTTVRNIQKLILLYSIFPMLLSVSCADQTGKKFAFAEYPEMKIGFTTQNFQIAMPNSIENLTEIIEYASKEGYHFIQLRDNLAMLTTEECMTLAETARKNRIDVIYEIHINLLDPNFTNVFEKGLKNTLLFPGPGILRTVISLAEFNTDPERKGWSEPELKQIIRISDSCATVARNQNIRFIVENFNEAFFGDGSTYFGIADFFNSTTLTGFQFDLSNPFTKTSRARAEPESVAHYLSGMGERWVTTHLKTIEVMGGSPLPILTENPLSVKEIIELMGKQNVIYASLELATVNDKQQCFDNHKTSIQFLKDRGVLKK